MCGGGGDPITSFSKAVGLKDPLDKAKESIDHTLTQAADTVGIKKPLDDAKKSIDNTLTQAADAIGIKKPLDDAVNSIGDFTRDPIGTLSDGVTNFSDFLGLKKPLDDAVNSAGEFMRDPFGTLSDGLTNFSDFLGLKEPLDQLTSGGKKEAGTSGQKNVATIAAGAAPIRVRATGATSDGASVGADNANMVVGPKRSATFLTGNSDPTGGYKKVRKTLLGG